MRLRASAYTNIGAWVTTCVTVYTGQVLGLETQDYDDANVHNAQGYDYKYEFCILVS